MEIEIQLTHEPIAEKIFPPQRWFSAMTAHGAWLEFRGVVRSEENGQSISALEYEAYPEMAESEIRRLLTTLAAHHACLTAKVIHRLGVVPVSETAIYVGVAGVHRGEAMALLTEFMNRLKQDVPIWKRRALPVNQSVIKTAADYRPTLRSLDEAVCEINSHCQPLPSVRVALTEAFGRVLRETVCAPEYLPDCDRSTRDGFAILEHDNSKQFQVVDTIHAADWKLRELKTGEAVRVATGAPLPCANLRVVMQEHVERNGDRIKILKREDGSNLRRRGEDVKAGMALVGAGARLDAGKLALLATAGRTQPLVSPRLRICHFTTGDEIVPPNLTPKPGQIRDSNSTLIRGLLQSYPAHLRQAHLPENFELAKSQISNRQSQVENCDVILVSGGASVGDKDFTRALLEWLGFEIIFSQVNLRPGRPLIFGMRGGRIAFGLPGNPLSHFVCFHSLVALALAKLIGKESKGFMRGKLAEKLEDAPCPRETLWPARLKFSNGELRLFPLKWSSSGDVTCLVETSALIRVPANQGSLEANTAVDFLLTTDMMDV